MKMTKITVQKAMELMLDQERRESIFIGIDDGFALAKKFPYCFNEEDNRYIDPKKHQFYLLEESLKVEQ